MNTPPLAEHHPRISSVTGTCYQCGDPIPQGSALQARMGGKQRAVCSVQCQQTAQWIDQLGLSDFYRLRRGPSPRQTTDERLAIWADPALAAQVLRDKGNHQVEACLLMDGMHCAGCVWLIERLLLKLGHIHDIQINPVTHRVLFTFDDQHIRFARILEALQQAGYRPRPLDSHHLADVRHQENRDLLKRLLVAGFGMMQVMTYTFVLYMENFGALPGGTKELFRWLGFLVSTPVVFYSAAPFFRNGWSALKNRMLNMDVPIAVAIATVYGSSVHQALTFQGEVYFESVSMLVFFLLAGRYLELRARHHAMDNADALIKLTPAFAERRTLQGTLETVPVQALATGDRIQVQEGDQVPADGILLSPHARLDEALLSGESRPCARSRQDSIMAGSLVLEGPIDLQVTRTGADTFLATLAQLATRAQAQRPRLSRRNERVTALFVLRVLILTALTLAGWLWYDPAHALEATIALLVVACPCALGLAAPAAITRALGVLARRNVLVIQPDALDTLNQINHAVFDKTGTLTEPQLRPTGSDVTALQWAASLARESRHPLSRALVNANRQPLLVASEVRAFPGLGLEGKVQGRNLRLGQPPFALSPEQAEIHQDAGLVLGENGQMLARFDMDEILRPDGAACIAALQTDHISCELLSGDSKQRVQAMALQLGLDQWRGRQLPPDKLARLQQLQSGQRCVLMVGDGSNDAPVLAGADVSVVLASGAELAQANADILICDGRLSSLSLVRQIARETRTILRQNQLWAMSYNTLAMPAAALGFIPPWLAAIFMSASSLVVVVNALRIGKTL